MNINQIIVLLVIVIASALSGIGFMIRIHRRLKAEAREAKENAELIFNSARMRANSEIANADARLRTLSTAIEQSPVTTVITDLAGNIVFVNPKFTESTGYTAEEAIGKNPRILKTGNTPKDEYKTLWQTILAGENWHGIFQNKKKNGELYWESATISPVKDEMGKITHFLAVKEDITERKRAEEELQKNAAELALSNDQLEDAITKANELAAQAVLAEAMMKESEARYRAVAQSANDAIITSDSAGNIVSWNRGAETIFGYTETESYDLPLIKLMPGSFQDDHLAGMIRLQNNGEKHLIGKTVEVNGQRKDGRMIPLEISLAEWQVNSDKFYTAIIRDITERKHLENELQQRATTDELTGIANRRYLLELAHREIKRAVRSKNPLAIALIDIDRFKHINDTYGHAAGDLALTAFTKICQRNIREIDVFARFGGDEFALLLPDTNCEQAYLVVERARQAIAAQTMEFEGQSFSINISAGIASLSDAPETFDTLLSRADRALYRAKEEGRNTVMTCADV